ncbi:DNA photolyase family protein [Marinomonas sp. C2222]|uniref:DNA photolyase family protein n=1 Tax=Marinomonas sargassi TaxID=2984494 RepID=A0ABT2YUU4_9GAMM|nr:deoxyribodipyrimidine photo-lyase [Marinomonas sargassi]MCV2403672.1 DNA photolyase family protein [Marinomonas sargassi]
MNTPLTLMWFEQDLRLEDNPALTAALAHDNVLVLYILDDQNAEQYKMGGASRWWLHHSLASLDKQFGNKLNFYQGDAESILESLCSRLHVDHVFWNRRYEPWRIARDKKIKASLLEKGIQAKSFNGSLLNEPWQVVKPDQTPYKVFTPYHNQASKMERVDHPLPIPNLTSSFQKDDKATTLKALSLLPEISWDKDFYTHWTPGEASAQAFLKTFLTDGLDTYKEGRDFPALQSVSKLSPHLHFGEISPRQIHHVLKGIAEGDNKEHFYKELRWREFSYYLLFHWPELPTTNLKTSFRFFPWTHHDANLQRWQQGLTGYPMVDAGMRELWQTGYMHNRVRMITASFLVKNLLIDWRCGARWFWDCLVDADLASNSASWQWVAGCGTDASPYFRIFNPVTQGEKFDPEGEYTRRYLPELKDLPKKYLYRPWEAPEEVLKAANVVLGETYPHPMVDIKESREQALSAYEVTKQML